MVVSYERGIPVPHKGPLVKASRFEIDPSIRLETSHQYDPPLKTRSFFDHLNDGSKISSDNFKEDLQGCLAQNTFLYQNRQLSLFFVIAVGDCSAHRSKSLPLSPSRSLPPSLSLSLTHTLSLSLSRLATCMGRLTRCLCAGGARARCRQTSARSKTSRSRTTSAACAAGKPHIRAFTHNL